jgi:PGF-pre-PGF domain-containing protein
MRRGAPLIVLLLTATLLAGAVPPVRGQLRSPTQLAVSPSTFTVASGGSVTLTATLTSGGTPLANRLVAFSATLGTVTPSGVTDQSGQVRVTYTAPAVYARTTVTITASFAGDIGYEPSSASSSGVVEPALRATALTLSPSTFTVESENSVVLTATLTSGGAPLAGKPVEFAVTLGTVNPPSGSTGADGRIAVTYTAPAVPAETPVTVTVRFAGDLEYAPASASSSGTIVPKGMLLGLPEVAIRGASFGVPETLKDDVSSYRADIPREVLERLPVPVPSEAFILATPENLLLILADRSDEGMAAVEGWRLPRDMELAGVSLSVVVARSVSFEKEGKPARIGEILADPKGYEFELVKIDATRRHISVLCDPDDGSGIEFPVTLGYLTEGPVAAPELVQQAIRRGRELLLNPTREAVRGIATGGENRLPVFHFRTDFWIDAPATTSGIVLLPGSRLLKLFENAVPRVGGLIRLEENRPVLYDVRSELKFLPVSSVLEINRNPGAYENRVVGLTVYGYQGTVSVQESLREVIPCRHVENWIEVQTPEGSVCLPADLDVRLEGIVVWNDISIPPRREELLIAVGASSIEQDTVFENRLAEFRLVGRIVSTGAVDRSLPEGLALVVYAEEKVRDVSVQELVRERVGENLLSLNWVLSNFSDRAIPGIPSRLPSREIFQPVQPVVVQTPQDLPELVHMAGEGRFVVRSVGAGVPLVLGLENWAVSGVSLTLRNARDNVEVVLRKLEERPPELPAPPGLVYAYVSIDVNVPDEAIENAEIVFWVPKGWLASQGVGRENVVLLRFHGGSWRELPTEALTENATHVGYSSRTPGFSTFAVTARVAAREEKPTQVPVALVGVVGAIVAVAVIAVVLRRRRGPAPAEPQVR